MVDEIVRVPCVCVDHTDVRGDPALPDVCVAGVVGLILDQIDQHDHVDV